MPITINGSGTVTGLSPRGLPDGSIQQADLAAGVAGNGPAFVAYASAAQNIPTGSPTKIQVNTEEIDTASCFDNTSNYRFTPNVAGFYLICGAIHFNSGTSPIAIIYKNGAEYARGPFGQGTSSQSSSVSAIVYMNGTTDYVELFGYQQSGGTLATQVSIRSLIFFQGCLIRSA